MFEICTKCLAANCKRAESRLNGIIKLLHCQIVWQSTISYILLQLYFQSNAAFLDITFKFYIIATLLIPVKQF